MSETVRQEQNYCCPKCRNQSADAREIVLSKSGLLDLLPSRDNRYIEVTCTLCGYTEFYNRALYVRSRAQQAAEARLPLPERSKGG